MDCINKSSENCCFVKNNMSGWMIYMVFILNRKLFIWAQNMNVHRTQIGIHFQLK